MRTFVRSMIFNALADASTLKPSVLDGVDCVIVRRAHEADLYFGERERTACDVAGAGVNGAPGQQAYDTLMYSEYEIERIVRHASRDRTQTPQGSSSLDRQSERARNLAHVASDRASYRRGVSRCSELIDMLVDNAAMQLINDPKRVRCRW